MSDHWDDDRPGMMRIHIAEQRGRDIAAVTNRETLRRICRAKNLPSGGSKHDLAVRLAFAGVTAADLTIDSPEASR